MLCSRSISSPPITRWSNCCGALSGMVVVLRGCPASKVSYGDAWSRSRQRTVAEMRDDTRMTIASCCHQHPVRHFPTIVEDRVPGKRGHHTIRFLHDQIGRGQVPVAALAAGKGDIEARLRDPAEPERE